MQSAAVQRPCCGLGKISEFTYLPTEPPVGSLQPSGTAEPRQEPVLAVKVTSEQKGFQRPSSLAPGLWKQLGFRSDCLHNAQGWKEQSVSATNIKKSKHLSFCFLLGFQDTALEDIKVGHPANKDKARHQPEHLLTGPSTFPDRLTIKKKGSTETPTTQKLRTVSTWQSPRLEQGAEPGWACQETCHFHM